MKTILLILFALALFTRAQVPGYQAIDITEAQSSAEIQTLISFGLQTIIQDATSLGYFNNTDFTVSQINGIYESVSDSGDYLFDVVYADPSGVTINANFEANYDVSLNSISIISYSYGVSYPGVDPSGEVDPVTWTPVSLSTFNSNQELQNLFQFGFANVVTNGINNGSIPNTTFVSASLSAIAQRSVANGVVYRFTCKASDKLTTSLNVTFEVVNQLQSSVYDVTVLPTPPDNGNNSTNTTEPETGNGEDDEEGETDTGSGSEESEESEEGEDDGSSSEEGEDDGSGSEDGEETIPIDPVEPGNNSTNTTEPSNPDTNTTLPGDDNSTAPADDVDIVSGLTYTRLDIDDALESSLVSTALKYGYNAVAALGIQQGKLLNTTYSLLEVDKIGRSNLTNGVSYLFQVNLIGDNRKILVDSNYTVYYRYSNKTLKLTAYYYNYTIYKNPLPSDDNTTEPTTPGNNTDNGNTTAPGNTTEPTTPGNNTDNGNTTAPGNNTDNGNTTTPVVDLYTQIQQDSLLESLFSFGVDKVLASGIAKGKIPNTDYNVTDVFNYTQTNLTKTANFRFETKLANNNGSVVIFTNFTVNYRWSNESMKLNALSYNVSITKVVQPSNNTNTTVPNNSTNTTVPDNGNNSTNTTVPDNTNNSTNTTVPDNNTYVPVNASDIAASAEIQTVISYGTSQILQKGLAAGKIPSANYTVSEVVSVSKLAQTGGNSYQCSVNLDGDNDVEVKTTFTAFYNATSQAVSLSKYSYAVLNIPVA